MKKDIFFFFNQLAEKEIYTGGEVRGTKITNFFSRNKKYSVHVVCPSFAADNFPQIDLLQTGNNFLENSISRQKHFNIFILYLLRTIETLKFFKKIRSSIIYNTGDFFCNTVPGFLIKVFYPTTTWVVCIHHINENPLARKSNMFISSLFSFILQRISFWLIRLKADLIFVVNKQVKEYLINHNFKCQIVVSGNGLDIKYTLRLLKSIKVQNNPPLNITYFGRISPTKGALDLPLILSQLKKYYPNIILNLIGKGDKNITNIITNKFKNLGCFQQVIIHNFIPDKKKVYQLILNSTAIIFPSYEEGWGISLFESVICRRPVIAYDLPIFKLLFENHLFLVPLGDTYKFSQTVLYIIKNRHRQTVQKQIDDSYKIASQYDWENVYNLELKAINQYL